MTNIAINARAACAMTFDAPSHGLFDVQSHPFHIPDLAMTRGTFNPGLQMWLVIEEDISFSGKPVDTNPGRLLPVLRKRGQFLDFRLVGLHGFVARHTGRSVRNGRVRPLVPMFMTEHAVQFGPLLLLHMLPVTELDRLNWGLGLIRASQHGEYDT